MLENRNSYGCWYKCMYDTPAVLYGWVLQHTSVNFRLVCRGVRKTVLDVTPLLTNLSLPPSLLHLLLSFSLPSQVPLLVDHRERLLLANKLSGDRQPQNHQPPHYPQRETNPVASIDTHLLVINHHLLEVQVV